MEVTKLQIQGMHCTSCAKIIKMELVKVSGIIQTDVDFDSKKALIKHNPAVINAQILIDLISNLGYSVKEEK